MYTFTVGYHELTGSKVPLKKPLLVLKKKKCVDEDQSGDTKSATAELEVIGIIRQRILFKTRPKALISSKLIQFHKIDNVKPNDKQSYSERLQHQW